MSKYRRRKIWFVLTIGCLLCLGSLIANADTLEDAKNAYGAGEFEEAITLLRPLVRQEDQEAAYLLGRMYEQGDGIAKDLTEAKRLYQIAANKGHEAAQQRLDIFDAQGTDESVVIEWYLPAAHEGDTEAQYNLGFMYETGWGVPVNETEAVRWYREAAEMQHDIAQLRLGMMLIVGVGVEPNQTEGIDLIRNSAENGNRIAEALIQDIFDVGELTQEQSSRIIAGLRRILDEGESRTLEVLRRSLRDVHKRKERPVQAVAKPEPPKEEIVLPTSRPKMNVVESVSRNRAPAQVESSVPSKTTSSTGKARTDSAAVKPKGNLFQFYSEAANRGDADAQFHLGAMYIKGDQVNKDLDEGIYWMKLATEQGHEMATSYMELWQEDISQSSFNSTVAINWLKEAGRQWNVQAIFSLGVLYHKGRGVDVNFKKAMQWYQFAAVEGHAEAKRQLALLKKGVDTSQEGIASHQTPGSGVEMSPIVIIGSISMLAVALGLFFFMRKNRELKVPSIQQEEKEVFHKANTMQGLETDDRKFFDELWGSKATGESDQSRKPSSQKPEEGAKRSESQERDNVPQEDVAIKSAEMSEIEKKLAKAVDDLININPETREVVEKATEMSQPKSSEPVAKASDAPVPAATLKEEKPPAVTPVSKTNIVEEKIDRAFASPVTGSIQTKVDAAAMGSNAFGSTDKDKKRVFGADDFLKNGISKDALAASRISADRLFADGVAIDEKGQAVGRGSFNPQKLDADEMISINELSLSSKNTSNVKKKPPIGAAASLLPKRSLEDEIAHEVEQIHKSDERTAVDVSGPFTQDEERSLAEVHYNIGVMFSAGDGVPKNDAQAAKWFLKAAEEGLPEAQYSVGQCYLHGTGVAKNTALGLEWIQKAAHNNFEPAKEILQKRNQAM